MAITDPAKTYTLQGFIDMKDNDSFTYANLALHMQSIVDKTVIFSSDNVIYSYLDDLKNVSIKYTFTEEEFMKYKYKPKLLAYDIYGATELYFIILAINDMCNIKDFKKRTINLIYKKDLDILLNQIYSAEQNRIELNRKSIELAKREES